MKFVCFAVGALCIASAASSANGSEWSPLFSRKAEISAGHAGLVRLVLPAEVLEITRPDLSDLRIIDANGQEVPYVLDAHRAPSIARRRVAANTSSIDRDVESPPGVSPTVRERYELTLPSLSESSSREIRPVAQDSWSLVVDSDRPEFVRWVRVEQKASDGRLVVLVERSALFRVGAAQKNSIALPEIEGTLVVTIEGREAGYLAPRFHFEAAPVDRVTTRAEIPLQQASLESSDGTTVVELVRPPGLVPDALRIDTTTRSFVRTLQVLDLGPNAQSGELGNGAVLRVAAEGAVESLDLELTRSPSGDHLRLKIANLDSPPLEGLTVRALVQRPVLVFTLPRASDGAMKGTLLFGGGRTFRPIYDLAHLDTLTPVPAGAEGSFGVRAGTADATLGPIEDNPDFGATPALEFAMKPGTPLETSHWKHRRSIELEPGPDGLSRLALSPEDGAAARADLTDVRIVDEEGRQWPYLLDRDSKREWREVAVRSIDAPERESRFEVVLPAASVRVDELEIDTESAFVDRAYRVTTRDESGKPSALTSGRLTRDPHRVRPLAIQFPKRRVEELELHIDDGDDRPLVVPGARLSVVLSEIYVAAPAGHYGLLLGNPEAESPRYELERARNLVLSVPAADANPGPLSDNPDFRAASRLASSANLQAVGVWAALGTTLLILIGFTLKAARQEGGGKGGTDR